MKRLILTTSLVALATLSGCTLAEVKVNVASERTSLENQILGSYNSLSEETLLVASVRGVDPLGRIQTPPRKSREQQDAITAMQVTSFHADDVDAFKRLGWVGEDNKGLLTGFPLTRDNAPDDLKDFAARYQQNEFNAVLAEVNRARDTIMRRAIETNASLTQADLPKVRGVFAKLNEDTAKPGEKVQTPDGAWTVKK
ncbi:MAG: DUF1318 domain-containing protein [Humidesulfovibrio sp.]|uniref:DUF1318 domain-containing protein n=1 Tax=Humidesulfovibrio sp. TaxID=2910988 RepID=UPI0027F48EAB|nr:DUF1318 domain-containing protein [Humidesulfovibrio sp.]MDQ7834057.1 DUF1318 domain-containing protein [Humidesulfovibrio sp.]